MKKVCVFLFFEKYIIEKKNGMIKIFADKFIKREYRLKYLICSVISGILLALSFEKFNYFFLVWAAFIPLLACIDNQNLWRSALYGFIAGFTYSLISLNWMLPFLLINTHSARDSIILSLFLWIYTSLYFSIWAFSVNFVKNYINKLLLMFFSCGLWICLEFARNYILSGFPVNLLGYSQSYFTPVIQMADIAGVYGVSFVIIFINMMLYFWIKTKEKKYFISSIVIFSVIFFYGFARMRQFDAQYGKKITIGVVQPDIKQHKKWNAGYKKEILDKLKKTAGYFEDKKVDIIVYPETVLPGKIQTDEKIRELIKNISIYADLNLVGGKYYEYLKVYNSVFLIDKNGNLLDKYIKNHLVIFGEYIPFNGLLNNLFKRFDLFDDFTKGEKLQVFKFDKYTLGINICSENFYPYLSRQLVLKGADILTTHSNDSWCDGLFYPYQHFVMNIFRAAENRKNIIVVSNTGISGVLDCCGRIIKKTKNEEEICFTSEVYTNNYITAYDKTGDIIVYLSLFFACGILIFAVFSKIKKRI